MNVALILIHISCIRTQSKTSFSGIYKCSISRHQPLKITAVGARPDRNENRGFGLGNIIPLQLVFNVR